MVMASRETRLLAACKLYLLLNESEKKEARRYWTRHYYVPSSYVTGLGSGLQATLTLSSIAQKYDILSKPKYIAS